MSLDAARALLLAVAGAMGGSIGVVFSIRGVSKIVGQGG
jgi:hypothetical protein